MQYLRKSQGLVTSITLVSMSMEKRERSLPDWLANLDGKKPLPKKKRQVPNSNQSGSSKRVAKAVSNGTISGEDRPSESVSASLKNVESLGSACDSLRDNDSPRKVPPFDVSSSEDENTNEAMKTKHTKTSLSEGTEKDTIVEESNDASLDHTEPLSPSLCEEVPSSNVESSAASEEVEKVDQPVTSTRKHTASNSVRRICKYGDKCFRKNPQHLQDFIHPGDDDFSAVDNRPECEYGLSCYRKNPLHRQQYKHTKNVRKPRKAKRPQSTRNDNSDSDEGDDDDLDDPFINDGSSDDYEPEGSGSDTDFSDGLGSEDDVTELQKEAKKLKRKR